MSDPLMEALVSASEGARRLKACLAHGLDAPHNDDCKGNDTAFWDELKRMNEEQARSLGVRK